MSRTGWFVHERGDFDVEHAEESQKFMVALDPDESVRVTLLAAARFLDGVAAAGPSARQPGRPSGASLAERNALASEGSVQRATARDVGRS